MASEKPRKIEKTESEWREQLTPEQYHITREKGTEQRFSGELNDNKAAGSYQCICCGVELFTSEQKYDSGCGWPSFFDEAGEGNIDKQVDTSHDMVREEIICSHCGAHLGHRFPDGPPQTGLRYCVNSLSLKFKKKEQE